MDTIKHEAGFFACSSLTFLWFLLQVGGQRSQVLVPHSGWSLPTTLSRILVAWGLDFNLHLFSIYTDNQSHHTQVPFVTEFWPEISNYLSNTFTQKSASTETLALPAAAAAHNSAYPTSGHHLKCQCSPHCLRNPPKVTSISPTNEPPLILLAFSSKCFP